MQIVSLHSRKLLSNFSNVNLIIAECLGLYNLFDVDWGF